VTAPFGGETSTPSEENPEAEANIDFQAVVQLPSEPQSTGEEDDKTLSQFRVKLYEFEKGEGELGWKERGVGTLKVNEVKGGGHRILMRTEGTQRLILNFKVFREMQVDAGGDKKANFTATNEFGKVIPLMVRFNKNEQVEEFIKSVKSVIPKK
jgi:hypothetical protein